MELRVIILSVACFSCLMPPALSHIFAAKAAAIGSVAVAKGAAIAAAKGAAVALAAKGALALKGLAIKGAALLAKGAAVKGAALLAAKGAAIKGLVGLLVKGAAAKAAALHAAKGAAINGILAAKKAALAGAVDIGATAITAAGAAKASALHSLLHWPEERFVVHDHPQEVRVVNHKPRWAAVAPGYYLPGSPAYRYVTVNNLYRVPQPIPEVPAEFPSVLAERLSLLSQTAADSIAKQAGAAGELVSALQQAKINSLYPPSVE